MKGRAGKFIRYYFVSSVFTGVHRLFAVNKRRDRVGQLLNSHALACQDAIFRAGFTRPGNGPTDREDARYNRISDQRSQAPESVVVLNDDDRSASFRQADEVLGKGPHPQTVQQSDASAGE